MCRLPAINTMVIFGGTDQPNGASNTVHKFDLNLEVWTLSVPVSSGIGGSVPSPRKGHTAVCLDNTMIVYGGQGGTGSPVDNDVWVLDASKPQWVWNRMSTNKQAGPGQRSGHTALLNGTNMIVWGGWGSPIDTTVYVLDTTTWMWTSETKTLIPSPPVSGGGSNSEVPDNSGSNKNQNLPLTIGIVCGSLALILGLIGFVLLRRRSNRRNQHRRSRQPRTSKESHSSGSMVTAGERPLSREIALESKPPLYGNSILEEESGSSIGRRSQTAIRHSFPKDHQQHHLHHPLPSLSALTDPEQRSQPASSSRPESTQSSLHPGGLRQWEKSAAQDSTGAASVTSDPFYPAHLAEDDEEDADRWTFASSLSFDHRDHQKGIPTLRYIPSKIHVAPRSLGQSTGSLATNSQRVSMIMQPTSAAAAAAAAARRDPSGLSLLSKTGSSSAGPTSTDLMNLEVGSGGGGGGAGGGGASAATRDTLFNSVSPLDRVTLICSGMDVGAMSDEDGVLVDRRKSGSLQQQQQQQQQQNLGPGNEGGNLHSGLQRAGTTSTSTTQSSTAYTTLEHPALASLVNNLPARYKLSRSPCPILGETNNILFAIDSDTQLPIVIKSFARREAWERECRMLRRLRGPFVVELRHVATLTLAETDDPNKPAKVRLTILERLDETLAQMLKNARKAKKVALREQAQSSGGNGGWEALDLGGVGLYQRGPALDQGYIRDIAQGVLRCLSWCHSKRIVYCDLKPSNVMHNRDDPRQQWKLIDLESSRVASEECIGIGTVRYCPPEVARGTTSAGSSGRPSQGVPALFSIDMWAFGCLLYELFATRPLFPLSVSDDTVLHFLAHPSPQTPALHNGLRWASSDLLEIPYFESAVPDESARQLIRALLHPDPHRRATLAQAMKSDYLGSAFISQSARSGTSRPSSPQGSYIAPPRPRSVASNHADPSTLPRLRPCLVLPLPAMEDSSQWQHPESWNADSFTLHFLCQHGWEDTQPTPMKPNNGKRGSFGHFVPQQGLPVHDPRSLFRELRNIIRIALDHISAMEPLHCPPGFEFLEHFEYRVPSPLPPQAISSSSSSRLSHEPLPIRGLRAYCMWLKHSVGFSSRDSFTPPTLMRELEVLRGIVDQGKGQAGLVRTTIPITTSSQDPRRQLLNVENEIEFHERELLVCSGHINNKLYDAYRELGRSRSRSSTR
ncbi:Cyclin-dependent kinase 12 [Actinomortierella ambigua]|nr:Cyclin-dependent kinase 12 [Actinomortierella ambigua]